MAAKVQQLRTTSAGKIPDSLEIGQIAFNLANKWMFVGVGGADILVHNKALTAYGGTQTILGVPNVTVPAKPAANKGYEIFDLEGAGITSGAATPAATAANAGTLFINTATAGAPQLLISNGTAFVPVAKPPSVHSLTDKEVHDAAGGGFTAKANAALVTKGSGFAAANLQSGDQLIVTAGTGGPYTDAPLGSYIWDGTNWVVAGAGVPDATARTGTGAGGTGGVKGVVYLARDTDVAETGATGSTTPDPLAVATAAQVKALADLLGGLITGSTLLGTYDGSTGLIASATAAAAAGGRAGFTVGANISAGTGQQEGDYFIVSKAGTPTGDAAPINVALNANDHIVYTGAAYHVIASGVIASTVSLHSCVDVSDAAVGTVTSANTKGLLVRDSSVADGLPNAWKLVDVVDLGTFAVIAGVSTLVLQVLQGAQIV